MQPNKFGNGEWIPPGQSIQVAGETIHDGMIYVGTSLSVHGGSVDPCLIDISKQVSAQGEFTKKRVGNFPSYSDISKEARRVYLNWLARGRSDPKIDSGYVLLFLYGLERRVIFDSTKDSCVDLEWRTIAQEIDRLLRIYGQKSGMFASSAVQLWDWVSLTRTLPSRLYNEPLPTLPCTFELSLYFQIALGQAARDNAPISKELALAWVKKDRRFKVVIPDTRYEEQFDSLFIPNYSGKFGEGMMLNKGKSGLEYVYTPSCVDWRYIKITKRSFDDIPTVIRSTIAYKKLNEIVDLTRAGLSLLIEENKRRDKPFSTATVSSVSQNRRVVLLDGTCFQHPEYQKLSPKMRGVGPISDMRNLVQALSNDAPADYGVCVLMDSETAPLLIHRDTRGVETD